MFKTIRLLCFLAISSALTLSCIEDGPERLPLPPVLKNIQIDDIIGKQYITDLEAIGFPIHRGNTPPDITGCYLTDEFYLVASNLNSDITLIDFWDVGWGLTRFFNYVEKDRRINIENKSKSKPNSILPASESASQSFGNISGTGNNFTYFGISTGDHSVTDYNSPYYGQKVFFRAATIISGTKTAAGIQNYVSASIFLEKTGDPNNQFTVPVGTIRVFQELDMLAANTNWNSPPWNLLPKQPNTIPTHFLSFSNDNHTLTKLFSTIKIIGE